MATNTSSNALAFEQATYLLQLPSIPDTADEKKPSSIRPSAAASAFVTAPRLRDLYCEAHGLQHEDFVEHFMPKALHRRARLLYPLLRIFIPDIDRNDREVIDDLGACMTGGAVRRVLGRLPYYYVSWNFWRRTAKLRISSRRVLAQAVKYSLNKRPLSG